MMDSILFVNLVLTLVFHVSLIQNAMNVKDFKENLLISSVFVNRVILIWVKIYQIVADVTIPV
jgi:hypothetical protein